MNIGLQQTAQAVIREAVFSNLKVDFKFAKIYKAF